MKILIGAAMFLFLSVGSVHAATDYYLKIEGVEGESRAQSTTTPQRVAPGTTQDPGAKGGNVEMQWKVEEGEKGAPADPTLDVMKAEESESTRKESGEKGGTEDINIGVGELQESEKRDYIFQHNETSLDFLKSKPVSVKAVEVRGWDPAKKQEFLGAVKAHAEIQSGEDLENFAKGVMLENTAVEEISLNFEKIELRHRAQGRLFGFIPISFTERVEVDTDGDDAGRIKVKFPWFGFLVREDVSASELEREIGTNEKWLKGDTSMNAGDNENWDFWVRAQVVTHVSNVLKTKHDTAKNSINNIR